MRSHEKQAHTPGGSRLSLVGPCDGEAPGHEGEAAANRRIRVCHGLVFRQSCREHRITRTRIRDGLQRRRAPAQRVAVARRSSSSSGGGSSLRARVDHRKGCRRLECGAVAAFRCPRDAGTRKGGDHAASCPARRRGQLAERLASWFSSAASLHGTDGRRAGKCLENGAALSRVKMHREIDLTLSII